jgi:hypothetical protein
MILAPVDSGMCPALEGKRTWTLWGNQESIASADRFVSGYGEPGPRSVAHLVDERMRLFLASLSISDFLSVIQSKYSSLRDHARVVHGVIDAKSIKRLRETLLTLSFDLETAARDVEIYWQEKRSFDVEARFTMNYVPWLLERDEADGRERRPDVDLNQEIRDIQRERFERLIAADRSYREILSTVATLGASVDTFRVSRMALWVAASSLGVAFLTFLITETGKESVVETILSWLRGTSLL